jgi:hypothetical protein
MILILLKSVILILFSGFPLSLLWRPLHLFKFPLNLFLHLPQNALLLCLSYSDIFHPLLNDSLGLFLGLISKTHLVPVEEVANCHYDEDDDEEPEEVLEYR